MSLYHGLEGNYANKVHQARKSEPVSSKEFQRKGAKILYKFLEDASCYGGELFEIVYDEDAFQSELGLVTFEIKPFADFRLVIEDGTRGRKVLRQDFLQKEGNDTIEVPLSKQCITLHYQEL